eukprot:COSAG05_NODE_11217_length_524_cov_1.343529_2_plen_92_part_01
MPPKREAGTPSASDAHPSPKVQALHASFNVAKGVSGLRKGVNAVSMVAAVATVMFALTWPPLTWGLWTLPAWKVGRPLGAFLTGWNKRMHPC